MKMFRIFLQHETTEYKTIQDAIYDERKKERIVFDKVIAITDIEEKAYDVNILHKDYEVVWMPLYLGENEINIKIPVYQPIDGLKIITKDNIALLNGRSEYGLRGPNVIDNLFERALSSGQFTEENGIYTIKIIRNFHNEGWAVDEVRHSDRRWSLYREGEYIQNDTYIVHQFYRKMLGD